MGRLNLQGSNSSKNQRFGKLERLSSPFGEVGHSISDSELKETAFEILVSSVCRHGGGESTSTHSMLNRTLGLPAGEPKKKSEQTLVEDMGIRMGVSKKAYKRIDTALKMIQGKQKGGNIKSIILPLELLEEFTVKDFGNQKAYKASQIRHLKILEAGLLPNPQSRLKNDCSILFKAWKGKINTRANSKWMQDVRRAVTSLAWSSSDGSDSSICHWADRFPLNLRLYEMLLYACFEINDKTSIVKEVNQVIEQIELTWRILRVNQMLHNLCFSSVLFCHSFATDQVDRDLLLEAATQLDEVAKDEKAVRDPEYSKILNPAFKFMLSEAEKRFLHYFDTFQPSNINSMKVVVDFGLSAAKIFIYNISDKYRQERKGEVDVGRNRVDTYQRMEKADTSKYISSKNQSNPSPALSILHDIGDQAKKEKEGFSPLLKRWNTFADVVDVATRRPCNKNDLKQRFPGLTA